ncbi:MAG: hypothetical protein E6Q76_05570 [Rhizobium sp.]|nr:MAG: hypothetical protein E6Q76_05570 [Rhizobium sp.]
MTLLAMATIGPALEVFHEKQGQRAADIMVIIGQAAQAYRIDNSAWPDESHNCANALSTLSGAKYLANISANSPYGGAWSFSCAVGGSIFSVNMSASNNDWASFVGGLVPAASVAGNNVTMSIPVVIPTHDTLLHRVPVAGKPQMNQMQTDLDMQNYNINNINNTNTATVNSTTIANAQNINTKTLTWSNGATLADDQGGSIIVGGKPGVAGTGSPYIKFIYNGTTGYNVALINSANGLLDFAGSKFRASTDIEAQNNLIADNKVIATNGVDSAKDVTAYSGSIALSKTIQDVRVVQDGGLVPYPTCPANMTKGVVFASESMAQGPNPSVFYGWKAWATADPGGTNNWIANVRVFTAAGEVSPSAGYGRIASFTYCY